MSLKELRGKIDYVIQDLNVNPDTSTYVSYHERKDIATQIINLVVTDILNEVVGELEPEETVQDNGDGTVIVKINPRNELRIEQRTKLQSYIKGGE